MAGNPEVQADDRHPADIEQLVNHDFASYYSENPAGRSRLRVWVNNSWVAAQCIGFAVLLGLPIPYVLFQNAANLGVAGGLMFDAGKGDVFLGLLTPHGLLELTAVFLAARGGDAAGLVGGLAGRPAARSGARRAGPRRGRRWPSVWSSCCWCRV